MVKRVDEFTPINRRQALPRPAKPAQPIFPDCAICHFSERYRDRLYCRYWHCSCPFARDNESQCGKSGKWFTARRTL